MSEPLYKDQVLVVEPTGIETIADAARHGSPRGLFGVWFSANAEIATWMVGVFCIALYGTDLRGAAFGIVAGNVLGYALLGTLATLGPRFGVPQMLASRLPFGRVGNTAPAGLSFLSGVGWFAINTIFGAYALQSIAGWPYMVSLAIMLLLQIVLAVYGYNLIHKFEAVSVLLLSAGFGLLAFATIRQTMWNAPFNAHAPIAAGGEMAGVIFASALAFSYATGWVPCASDYSRYLPRDCNKRSVWWYSFVGCILPCVILELLGAATVTALPKMDLSSAVPTQAIAALLGTSLIGKVVLATVVLGTLTANCMNLYSGALAALVAFSMRIKRSVAALAVGLIGALIATGGGHPRETAEFYTNFLLILSYWAAPWAAVVFVDWMRNRTNERDPQRALDWGPGAIAWVLGLVASVPFWNQAWYLGPVPHAFPQLGDLSYYVGFAVSGIAMLVLTRRSMKAIA